MSGRDLAAAIAWSTALGLFVALFRGSDLVISIELWLGAFAAWLTLTVLVLALQRLPLEPSPERKKADRDPVPSTDRRPNGLRNLEGIIRQARSDRRVYNAQLRPRLIELADHLLPLNHGVNPAADPASAALVLGDLAWMVNPAAAERTPSPTELARFVSLLNDSKSP